MALTPDDIAQKAFTPRFRGIDPVEVREFLLLAAAQIADLHDQITQQKEQIGEQEKELALAADDKKSFDDVLDVFKQKIDTLTAQLGETREQQANRDEEFKRVQQLLEEVQRERD
ncbi:MAG: DivIVA domain-containing protein, partial [Desulfofustis sp.]|nr:DivIVA domain-containing protein [Desulfofustis sp.]